MILPDGREHLVTLASSLPLVVAPELMRAIGEAAEECGYTDVVIVGDEQGRTAIAGTPPGAPGRQ